MRERPNMNARTIGLRIVNLKISGFKGITVADVTPPTDGVVVVSGRNGAGKSSLLDAIALALGGQAETRKVSQPIKSGQTTSQVVVDLGDITVTRKWEDGKSWLTVTGADGQQKRSPQTLLNHMLGQLSFDPTRFMAKEPREQRTMLLEATGLGPAVAELDSRRAAIYEERTLVGREAKNLQGELASMQEPGANVPKELVTASSLVQQIRETENANNRIRSAQNKVSELTAQIEETKERIAQMQEALQMQEWELSEATDDAQGRLVDTAVMEEQVQHIDETNRRVRSAQQFNETTVKLNALRAKWTEHSEAIDDLETEKQKALAQANLPITGLGVTDEGITYNGVPFSDANTASQLRTAAAIAMSLNPTIRIIRIADGSLLDDENLAALHEVAGDRGYQVWVERVADDEDTGIVIEDGNIVANHYDPPLLVD